MNSRDFRNTINKLIIQDSKQWIVYGDAQIDDDVLTFSDLDFLINAVKYSHPTALGLANINLGDEQLSYLLDGLQDNTSIKLLYFPFNKIGDKGAGALADLLQKNSHIKELILFRNKVCDAGMSELAMMLYTNTTLVKLELFGNYFSQKSEAIFTKALKCNNVIKTLLLYPANDGIHLTTNPQDNAILLKRSHKMMLLNVNKPENIEATAFKKLMTRR